MSHRRKVLLQLISNAGDNNIDGDWIFHNTINIDTGEVTYFILKISKNCSFSNNATTIVKGQTYTSTVIADEGKDINLLQITILHNGVDVTSTAYDITTHTITINNVIGNIDINAKIQSIPIGYTQYDWLQSNNGTYIDSGFAITSTTTVDFEFMAINPSADTRICGAYGSGWGWCVGTLNGYLRNMSTYGTYSNCPITGNKQHLISSNNGATVSLDSNIASFTAASNNTEHMFIFGFSYNKNAKCGGLFRKYNFKIYDNNVLVRDMLPCVRNSDLKPGMYDIINDVFYTNSGTGEFTYGNDEE